MPRRNIVKDLQEDLARLNSKIKDLELLRNHIEALVAKYAPLTKKDKE